MQVKKQGLGIRGIKVSKGANIRNRYNQVPHLISLMKLEL